MANFVDSDKKTKKLWLFFPSIRCSLICMRRYMTPNFFHLQSPFLAYSLFEQKGCVPFFLFVTEKPNEKKPMMSTAFFLKEGNFSCRNIFITLFNRKVSCN